MNGFPCPWIDLWFLSALSLVRAYIKGSQLTVFNYTGISLKKAIIVVNIDCDLYLLCSWTCFWVFCLFTMFMDLFLVFLPVCCPPVVCCEERGSRIVLSVCDVQAFFGRSTSWWASWVPHVLLCRGRNRTGRVDGRVRHQTCGHHVWLWGEVSNMCDRRVMIEGFKRLHHQMCGHHIWLWGEVSKVCDRRVMIERVRRLHH